jgi:hypothetical protein
MTLRWWRRHASEAVTVGLQTGVVPMAAALLLCHFGDSLPRAAAFVICSSAGLTSGAVIGYATTRPPLQWHSWMTSAAVAGLTAALGCAGLGVAEALGAAIGVLLGSTAVARVSRSPAA